MLFRFTTVVVVSLVGCSSQPNHLTEAPPALPSGFDQFDLALKNLIRDALQEIESLPQNAKTHGKLGMIYEANTMWAEARDAYRRAAKLEPQNELWPLHAAIAVRQLGDFESCLGALRQLIEKHPDFAPAQYRLGQAYLESGELSAASEAFAKVTQLQPESPEGYVGQADVLLRQNQPTKAVFPLQRALRMDGNYQAAHYLLGTAWQKLGQTEKAQRELALGANAKPRILPDAITSKIKEYAVSRFERLNRARSLLDNNDPLRASEVLESALSDSPENVTLLNTLAAAYLHLGRTHEARTLLTKAQGIDPKSPITHVNLAAWAQTQGKPGDVLGYADAALEESPWADQARLIRAKALLQLGRITEGLGDLTTYLSRHPSDAEAHCLAAKCQLRLGQPKKARRHYEQAKAIMPSSAEAHYGLTFTFLQLELAEAADEALQEGRRVAPNDPRVNALLEMRDRLQRKLDN